MICKHCKTPNSENAKFCRHCGQRLKKRRFLIWAIIVMFLLIIGIVVLVVPDDNTSPVYDEKNILFDENPIDADTTDCYNIDVDTGGCYDSNVKINTLLKNNGDSFMEIDFPITKNQILFSNIIEWINEELGGDYQGAPNDLNSMFEHYYMKQREDLTEQDYYSKIEIKKIYENAAIVTFIKSWDSYYGGAHPLGYTKGATFRKTDGKVLSMNSIFDHDGMLTYIVEGLKSYFNVYSDSELLERLSDITRVDLIPFPENNPWITNQGIVFTYAPYEIACYAEGSPSFCIPIDKVLPFFSSTSKSFFQ